MTTVPHEAVGRKRKPYRPTGKKIVTLWLPVELHRFMREHAFYKNDPMQQICERGIMREASRLGFKKGAA